MMPDAKRTKRVRDETEGLTLNEHIARKRKELVAAREAAPALRQQADELRARASRMTRRWQLRLGRDLVRHADELVAEADTRESMEREHSFERVVVTYLRRYYERDEAVQRASRQRDSIRAYMQHADVATQHRSSIVDEYLTEMQRAPPKVAMATRDECPRCDGEKRPLLLCAKRSVMCCSACGYSVTYLDATSSTTSFDETIEFSQYSYKRVNHFLSYLSLVQGKEAHRVPDSILDAVMADLYHRHGVRATEEITQRRVRESLRHLRLRKAYDHVAQVTSRLSGRRSGRVPPHVEEQLRNMFLQMQPAFARHAPKWRTNFLSYTYVIYRLFQILNLTHMLDGIVLLKSRPKLEANDAIFRKMCVDLGWPIFELPPASETMGG